MLDEFAESYMRNLTSRLIRECASAQMRDPEHVDTEVRDIARHVIRQVGERARQDYGYEDMPTGQVQPLSIFMLAVMAACGYSAVQTVMGEYEVPQVDINKDITRKQQVNDLLRDVFGDENQDK